MQKEIILTLFPIKNVVSEKEGNVKTMVVIGDYLIDRISQENLLDNQTTMYKYYPILISIKVVRM